MGTNKIFCMPPNGGTPEPPREKTLLEREPLWKKILLGFVGVTLVFSPGLYTYFRVPPFDRNE